MLEQRCYSGTLQTW